MSTLFVIAVLSCCALIWTAWAIARHVRRSAKPRRADGFAEALTRSVYSDPPVGGRPVRPHPREDLAAGRAAGTAQRSQYRSVRVQTKHSDESKERIDRRYNAEIPGNLADPDAPRSGYTRSTQEPGG